MAAKDGIRVHIYGDYDDKQINKAIKGLNSLRKESGQSESTFAKLGKSAIGLGAAFGVGFAGVSTLANVFRDSIAEAQEAIKVNAATAQIIKATGSAANVTAEQVADLSQSLSEQIAVDDELIQSSANLILTFKNVANQGTGLAAIFDRTVLAAQDLSAAGFGDAESAAKMLGKALNDPERGLTALSRAGVTFTQQQKDQIQTLTQGGDVLKAQQLILAEVESQVGGVAGATATGIDQFNVYFDNLKEELGLAILPLINALIGGLLPAIRGVSDMIRNSSKFFEENKTAILAATLAVSGLTAAMLLNRIGGIAFAAQYAAHTIVTASYTLAANAARIATIALTTAMRAVPFIAIATAVVGLVMVLDQGAKSQEKWRREQENTLRATDGLRDSTGRFTKEAVALGLASRGAHLNGERLRGTLSGTAAAAVAAGNAMGQTMAPGVYDANDAVEELGDSSRTVAGDILALMTAAVAAGQMFRQMRAMSGTVTSGIYEGLAAGADLTEARLKEIRDSLEATSGAARSSAGSTGEATAKFVKLNEVLPDLAATAAEFGVKFAPNLKIPNSEKLIDRLKGSVAALMDRLDKAKSEATDFGNSVADTFRGFLSIADASDAFQARQKAAVDALVELNAYRATMTAESTDDQKAKLQELADAHNRADVAARTGAQSIVAEFMAQAEEFGKFGEKMRRLLAAGLNKTTFTQIMGMSAERGGAVADAYLNGNTAELVAQTNNTVKAYDDLATTIGDQSAQTFYAAGISAAVAILRAFSKAMGKDGSTRKGLKAIIADLQDDMQINVKVNIPNVPSFSSAPAAPVQSAGAAASSGGFDFGPITGIPDIPAGGFDFSAWGGLGFGAFANGGLVKGPMLGLVGEAGPELIVPLDRLNGMRSGSVINVTVNAGMGTDGAQVGEQIVSALRAYERRNGALPITVAS
jgi:hypothetical protein